MKDFFTKNWRQYLVWAILLASGWAISLLTGNPFAPPLPPVPLFEPGEFGWIDQPQEVEKALVAIERAQGFKPFFAHAGAHLMQAADDDKPVFFWEAEQKVLKRILKSWDQGSIGSCVSHGWGRACQDLLLSQIALGANEEWPGAEVCREALYGGGRVQVGNHGKPDRGGDGSVGAWEAQWVQDSAGGILFYLKYPSVDLTSGYTVSRCRSWGATGCPADLVPVAKQHPVKGVALVKTAEEGWSALGSGYPIPICSSVGFASPLKEGFCARRGSWNHCMEVRGRFVHPQKGKCFVIQNSWGDYLKTQAYLAYLAKEYGDPIHMIQASNAEIEVVGRGKVQLPEGCFAITAADLALILRAGDSFAISSFKGFPSQNIDWYAQARTLESDVAYLVRKLQAENQWYENLLAIELQFERDQRAKAFAEKMATPKPAPTPVRRSPQCVLLHSQSP